MSREEYELFTDLMHAYTGMVIAYSSGAREAMQNGPDELERFLRHEYSLIYKVRDALAKHATVAASS